MQGHDKTDESRQYWIYERNQQCGLAEDLVIADAVNRLADAAERIAANLQVLANSAEIIVNKVDQLTDPLAVVSWYRQCEMIRKNLDAADQKEHSRESEESFSRILGMSDAELAS